MIQAMINIICVVSLLTLAYVIYLYECEKDKNERGKTENRKFREENRKLKAILSFYKMEAHNERPNDAGRI